MIAVRQVQSRFRSKIAWISLLSLIAFVAKNYFHVEIPHFEELTSLVITVLVAFGIFNNPSDAEKY